MKKELLLGYKKRLIALAMIIPMTLTSLTGCNNLKYEKQENGIVEVTGTIDYDDFKHYKLVHITNKIAELDKYYLVDKRFINKKYYPTWFEYTDIETNMKVYQEKDGASYGDYKNFKTEIILDGLVDYLYKYDMIKEEYTIEDILHIKECLLSDDVLFKDVTANKPNVRRRIRIQDDLFII